MDNPKENQLNIYVSAEFTVALQEDAKKETAALASEGISRAKVTKSGLAFELISWAYEHYRQAGSLRELKKRSVNLIEQSLENDRKAVKDARGEHKKKRKAG